MNEYDALLENDEAVAGVKQSLTAAIDKNPEQEAKLQTLSQETGAPIDALRDAPEQPKSLPDVDYDALVSDAPATTKFLTNPDNAALAQDDIEPLSGLEIALDFQKRLWKTTAAAFPRINEGLLGVVETIPATYSDLIGQRIERMGGVDLGAPAAAYIQTLRQQQLAQAQALEGGPASYDNDLSRGILSGVQSFGMVAPALIQSVVTRSPTPIAALFGLTTGGQSFGKARDAGVDNAQALQYAATQAAVEWGTEYIPALRLMKDLGVNASLLRTVGNQLIREIPGEQVATHVQDFSDWLTLNPEKPFQEYTDARGSAFMQTLFASIVGTALNTGVATGIHNAVQRDVTDQTQEALQAMADFATQSKLRERSPEKFEEAVRTMQAEGGLDAKYVYINPDVFIKHYSAQNQDAKEVAESLGITNFDEAITSGVDLSIPLDKYLSTLAPSPDHAALISELKLHPLAQASSEIQAEDAKYVKEVGEFAKELQSDEITDEKTPSTITPLFANAEDAGMSEAQFNAYIKRMQEASQAKPVETALTQEQPKQLSAFTEQARAETLQNPVYAFLENKDNQFVLSKEDVLNRFGQEALDKLPAHAVSEEGMNIDLAAEILGFPSGNDFIQQIMNAPPFEQAVSQLAQQKMNAERGITPETSVLQSVANETHAKKAEILHDELTQASKLNDKKTKRRNPTRQPTLSFFKQSAQGLIGQKSLNDIQPYQYVVAGRKASNEALKAMKKKDYEGAAFSKRKEILNHYLFLEALKAKEDGRKIQNFAARFSKKKKREQLGKAGADYLDQVDSILERYEFKPVSKKKLERRKSLANFIAERTQDNEVLFISDYLRDETKRINFREVPMDELRSVRDGIKNIDHLARLKTTLMTAQGRRDFAEIVDEMTSAALLNEGYKNTTLQELNDKHRSLKDKGAAAWRKFDAAHIKIEQLVSWLDGGKIDGPWAKYFFDLAARAQTKEYDLHREVSLKMRRLVDGMPKEFTDHLMDKTKAQLPNVGVLTRYDLISIALNTGNASNYKKLLQGRGWTHEQVTKALDELTKDEWKFIDETWQITESLWPEIVALQKRTSGLAPKKIEAAPQVRAKNAHTDLKGGYYPVSYDPRFSEAGRKQMESSESIQDFFAKSYGLAATDKGHTQERLEDYAAPLLLDYEQVITSHMARVIKDISHREAIIDLQKLLRNPNIKKSLMETLGEEYYKEMNKWMQVLVFDRSDTLHRTVGLASVFMKLRVATAYVSMGFKISTALAQLAGFTQSKDNVQTKFLWKGVKEFSKHPIDTYHKVIEKSGEMRNRSETIDQNLKEALYTLRGKTGITQAVRRNAFYLTVMADRAVSIPTWLGGYEQAQAEGYSEEDSIRAADRAVRLSQGTGAAKDLAAVQRDSELMKLLTMFYTPFSVLYSRLRDVGHQVHGLNDLPHATARILNLTLVQAVISELLGARGPDDDEDWTWWAARQAASYPLQTIPVLRDLSRWKLEPMLAEATGGKLRYKPEYQFSPIVRSMEQLGKTFGHIGDAVLGDRPWDDVAWEAFETSGYLLGLPTAQPRITGEYLTDVFTGERDPEDFAELMHGILFRTPKQ